MGISHCDYQCHSMCLTQRGTAQPSPYHQNKKLSTLFQFAPTTLKRLGHNRLFFVLLSSHPHPSMSPIHFCNGETRRKQSRTNTLASNIGSNCNAKYLGIPGTGNEGFVKQSQSLTEGWWRPLISWHGVYCISFLHISTILMHIRVFTQTL